MDTDGVLRDLTHEEEEILFRLIINGFLMDKIDFDLKPKGLFVSINGDPRQRELFFPLSVEGRSPNYPTEQYEGF